MLHTSCGLSFKYSPFWVLGLFAERLWPVKLTIYLTLPCPKNISEDRCAELECCQCTPIKQNKFLQCFPPCYSETGYLHSLLCFMKQPDLKTRYGMRQTECRSNAQWDRRKWVHHDILIYLRTLSSLGNRHLLASLSNTEENLHLIFP